MNACLHVLNLVSWLQPCSSWCDNRLPAYFASQKFAMLAALKARAVIDSEKVSTAANRSPIAQRNMHAMTIIAAPVCSHNAYVSVSGKALTASPEKRCRVFLSSQAMAEHSMADTPLPTQGRCVPSISSCPCAQQVIGSLKPCAAHVTGRSRPSFACADNASALADLTLQQSPCPRSRAGEWSSHPSAAGPPCSQTAQAQRTQTCARATLLWLPS